MNQKNGKKVIVGTVCIIAIALGATVVGSKLYPTLEPRQILVKGMIGTNRVHFWIYDTKQSSVDSEMLLMTKLKAPGDTILQVVGSSYAPQAYADSTILAFQVITDVEIAQQ